MPSTPEPSLEAPADPLPAPAASGDGAEAEPDEGSEPAEVTESIPAPEDFVRVADWIPDIYTDLRYAADNNFTGQTIYDFSDAYLRYGTVEKLAAVQETVAESGCSLLIWDAFRLLPRSSGSGRSVRIPLMWQTRKRAFPRTVGETPLT